MAFSVVANWVVGTLVQQFDADETEPTPPEESGFDRVVAFRREMLIGLSQDERFAEGLETVLAGVEVRYFPDSRSR